MYFKTFVFLFSIDRFGHVLRRIFYLELLKHQSNQCLEQKEMMGRSLKIKSVSETQKG
jgi:hypothetical protein